MSKNVLYSTILFLRLAFFFSERCFEIMETAEGYFHPQQPVMCFSLTKDTKV